jgi:hypothetical protein
MLSLHVVSHLPHILRFGPVRRQPALPISKETTPMLPELTTTGIRIMSELPWGTHFCYFYETKQDLLDACVPFFQAGLENREFCFWVVYSPLTEADALQALRKSIPALNHHLAEGGLEIFVHPDPFFDGDFPEPRATIRYLGGKLERALARDYTGMRAAGSPACLQKGKHRVFPSIRAGAEQVGGEPPRDRAMPSSAGGKQRRGNPGRGANTPVRDSPGVWAIGRSWNLPRPDPPRHKS